MWIQVPGQYEHLHCPAESLLTHPAFLPASSGLMSSHCSAESLIQPTALSHIFLPQVRQATWELIKECRL